MAYWIAVTRVVGKRNRRTTVRGGITFREAVTRSAEASRHTVRYESHGVWWISALPPRNRDIDCRAAVVSRVDSAVSCDVIHRSLRRGISACRIKTFDLPD